MPELPEIETLRRGLEREAVGRRVKAAEVAVAGAVKRNGTKKSFEGKVEGVKIKSVDRRGSLLVMTLDNGELLVVDVGVSGRLERVTPKEPAPDDLLLTITFTQGGALRLADSAKEAQAFVVTTEQLAEEVPALGEMGLDPVAHPVSWTAFARSLVARRTSKLKPLLLDPTFIVGLGGLYTDEILHDAGLKPDREVSTLSTMEIRRLYRSLVEILHEATKLHGTSTEEHPFVDLNGKEGGFQTELEVWGRDGDACRRCRGTVSKQRASNRITYWCASCQV